MSLRSKHSLALSLFLIAAASTFNPVSADETVTAFETKGDLANAVKLYCEGGSVDSKYGSIEDWDVSGITDMMDLFAYAKGSCNPPIRDWNVSNVANFRFMFYNAEAFNQDISDWDVSSGTGFDGIFAGATSLDQPLIYCKWQSNDSFKNVQDSDYVCNGANCGWGITTCPTPEPSPTAAPTAAAEKAKNAYQISLIKDSIDVAFNASRLDKEIMMNLNITTDNIGDLSNPIKVFDYDTCNTTEYGSGMLAALAMLEANTTMGVFSSVPVEVNLNTTDIVSYNNSDTYPGFFNAEDESVVLQFCLKPTLGSSDVVRNGVVETSYISYTKIKVQIKLNMTMDFSTAAVTIEEDAPIQTTKDSSVDYTLDAYECDAATKVRITAPSVKTQNSLVTVCIESSFDDIIVGSIKELTLTQSSSGLVFKAIDDSLPTAITEVSSTGTKKAAVTTRLVSAFFTDLGDEQSEIEITGTAVLKFGSGERKLVRIGNSDDRALQGNDSADPLGEFAVSVDILKDNDDMSAATQANKRFLATLLFSALMGSALVL